MAYKQRWLLIAAAPCLPLPPARRPDPDDRPVSLLGHHHITVRHIGEAPACRSERVQQTGYDCTSHSLAALRALSQW